MSRGGTGRGRGVSKHRVGALASGRRAVRRVQPARPPTRTGGRAAAPSPIQRNKNRRGLHGGPGAQAARNSWCDDCPARARSAGRSTGAAGGLLEALPQVLTLQAAVGDPLRDLTALLSHELAHPEPGRPTVLDRLLDVLLVLAIRSDFRRSPNAPLRYRAPSGPRLTAALQATHEDAGHPRSVPELAAISGLSRAAFARTSRRHSGRPPLQYLTDWRMALAREHLRTGELGMPGVARSVGYGSPYACAAAFRRHHGEPQGAWRQRESTRDGEHRPDGPHIH